jgi:predicted phage tail protein
VNLTNHLRRGLVVGVAAASVAGGAADITGAHSAATTTARTLSAVTTAAAAHTPTSDGDLAAVTAPSAPRSPTATSRNTVVRLTWLRPSSYGGATVNKYRVQRATSRSGPWRTIAQPSVRRYRAGGLTNGKKYFFRVAAHNPAGWGPYSKVVSAVPRTVPTAPRSPAATPGNTTVKLAWVTPSSTGGAAVSKYAVQRSTTGTSGWTTVAQPTTRTYTAKGLTNGKRYYFRIRAHNAAGWSPPSTVVSSVPRAVPTAPAAPYATPGDAFVSLIWDSSSSTGGAAIDKYEAELSTDQVNWTTPITTTKWNHVEYGGLTNGTTYFFRVRAHNAAGWGPWSTIVSATPRAVPSAPLVLWADTFKVDAITLYWNPPASDGGAAIDYYTIWYSDDKANWFLASTTANTHLTLGKPSITRHYRVRAHNEAGYGAATDTTVNIP